MCAWKLYLNLKRILKNVIILSCIFVGVMKANSAEFEQRVVADGDLVTGTLLVSETVCGTIECGSACSLKQGCITFGFNSRTHQCLLFKAGTTGAILTKTPDWELFRRTCRGGHIVDNRCMIVNTGKLDWHEAQNHCEEIGGRLALVDSQATLDAIMEILTDMGGVDQKRYAIIIKDLRDEKLSSSYNPM